MATQTPDPRTEIKDPPGLTEPEEVGIDGPTSGMQRPSGKPTAEERIGPRPPGEQPQHTVVDNR